MTSQTIQTTRDYTRRLPLALLLWGVPVVLLAATAVRILPVPTVWPLAFFWLGGACLANAFRCGRTHCYFTGAFFLLTGLVSVAHGFGWVPLGASGWSWIGNGAMVGGLILWFAPELIWGKYLRKPSN